MAREADKSLSKPAPLVSAELSTSVSSVIITGTSEATYLISDATTITSPTVVATTTATYVPPEVVTPVSLTSVAQPVYISGAPTTITDVGQISALHSLNTSSADAITTIPPTDTSARFSVSSAFASQQSSILHSSGAYTLRIPQLSMLPSVILISGSIKEAAMLPGLVYGAICVALGSGWMFTA
jgi:hypothetical protein